MEDQFLKIKDKIINLKNFRKNRQIEKDCLIDDIIKSIAVLHKSADTGLKELCQMCECQKDKDGESET
jgi:hypothetical protein